MINRADPLRTTQDRWLSLARSIWTFFAVMAVVFMFIGIPLRYHELTTIIPKAAVIVGQLRPQDFLALNQAGFSLKFYAAYLTLAEIFIETIFTVIAILIFWRRSNEWISLYFATAFLIIPLATPLFSVLDRDHLLSPIIFQAIRLGFVIFLVSFPFVFPDGRVIPRWANSFLLLWIIYIGLCFIFPMLMPPVEFGGGLARNQIPQLAWVLFSFALGVVSQIYRYRYVSTVQQRQQTKWVVWGLAILLICVCVGIFILTNSLWTVTGELNVIVRLMGPTIIIFGILFIPFTMAFSILRYRLFDIDLIIRRTLVYTALTASLAMIFFGGVVFLQRVFGRLIGVENSPVVIVISTLAIAALFNPLRLRIQTGIDRRFYRRKYDAQKTLERFASAARDEVELEQLTVRLLDVVNETIQPQQASIWLRPSHKPDQIEE